MSQLIGAALAITGAIMMPILPVDPNDTVAPAVWLSGLLMGLGLGVLGW